MQAIALDKFGGPEALKIQNLPIPQIEAQEVLIRVEAAGVGAWDPFEREGGFVEITGNKPTFPDVLGTDGAAWFPCLIRKRNISAALSLGSPSMTCLIT